MAVKIYGLPEELAVPAVNFANIDLEENHRQEEAHKQKVIQHYKNEGYTGPNTGKIYREQVADGYANYMVFEAPRGSKLKEKFFLIHLPYAGGYHSNNVRFLNKTEIIKRIEAFDKIMKLLKSSK